MLTTKTQVKELRAELKDLGYSNRKISIKHEYCGYSESVSVTIKDLTVPISQIEPLVTKLKYIRYDEVTQEVLEGANTYVNVQYDSELLYSAIDERLERAQKIIDLTKKKNTEFLLFETDTTEIIMIPRSHIIGVLSIRRKGEVIAAIDTNYTVCQTVYDIARFLVNYDFQIEKTCTATTVQDTVTN